MHYAILVSQLLIHDRFTRTRSISKFPNIFKLHVMKTCGCRSKHLRSLLMNSARKRVFSFTYGLLHLRKDKYLPGILKKHHFANSIKISHCKHKNILLHFTLPSTLNKYIKKLHLSEITITSVRI